jgi:hypothetical protein
VQRVGIGRRAVLMPSSTLLHTLVFAAGAVIGATAAASLNTRKEYPKAASSTPIVDVANGKLGLSPQQQALAGDVLKYGNPGIHNDRLFMTQKLINIVNRSNFRPDIQKGVYTGL